MKKVIVVGGSAGGIRALCSIVRELRVSFPAPLLAVIDVAKSSRAADGHAAKCDAPGAGELHAMINPHRSHGVRTPVLNSRPDVRVEFVTVEPFGSKTTPGQWAPPFGLSGDHA